MWHSSDRIRWQVSAWAFSERIVYTCILYVWEFSVLGLLLLSSQNTSFFKTSDCCHSHLSQGLQCKAKSQSEYFQFNRAARPCPCMQWLLTSHSYSMLLLRVKINKCTSVLNPHIDGTAAELRQNFPPETSALRGHISSISRLFLFLLQCFLLRVKTQLELSVPPPCSATSAPPRSWGAKGGRSAGSTWKSVPIYSSQVGSLKTARWLGFSIFSKMRNLAFDCCVMGSTCLGTHRANLIGRGSEHTARRALAK